MEDTPLWHHHTAQYHHVLLPAGSHLGDGHWQREEGMFIRMDKACCWVICSTRAWHLRGDDAKMTVSYPSKSVTEVWAGAPAMHPCLVVRECLQQEQLSCTYTRHFWAEQEKSHVSHIHAVRIWAKQEKNSCFPHLHCQNTQSQQNHVTVSYIQQFKTCLSKLAIVYTA